MGVKVGHGNIIHILTEIEVECLPKDLPEYLEVDMLNVDLGDSVHISDIKLPPGVESVDLAHGTEESDLAVATVQAPRGAAEEETDAPVAPAAVEATKQSDPSKAESKPEKKDK